jgi:hypothetical protein
VQKEAEKKVKYKSVCMETERMWNMKCDCTGNNWSHQNSNRRFKEKFGSHMRKIFNRRSTKDSCTWNSTHNVDSTAVRNWKHEGWGSPLVQDEYWGEKACDRRQQQNNNNRSITGAKQQQQHARAELGHSTRGGGGNLHTL